MHKDYQSNIRELAEEYVVLKQNSSQIFDEYKNDEVNSRNLASSISNRDQSKHASSKHKSQPFMKNMHMSYYKSLNYNKKVFAQNSQSNPMINKPIVQKRRKNLNILRGMRIGGKQISNMMSGKHTFDEDSYQQKMQNYQRNRIARSKNSMNDWNESNGHKQNLSQMNLVILANNNKTEELVNGEQSRTTDNRTIEHNTNDFRIYSQGLQFEDADRLFEGMEIH